MAKTSPDILRNDPRNGGRSFPHGQGPASSLTARARQAGQNSNPLSVAGGIKRGGPGTKGAGRGGRTK